VTNELGFARASVDSSPANDNADCMSAMAVSAITTNFVMCSTHLDRPPYSALHEIAAQHDGPTQRSGFGKYTFAKLSGY
jgi:hypothetical protein